jgi:hypothetical protein
MAGDPKAGDPKAGDPKAGGVAQAPARTTLGASAAGVSEVVTLGLLLVVAALLAMYSLWAFWPTTPATGSPPMSARFAYFGWHISLSRDQQFFLIAALAGGLGAMLHSLRSISTYVGERYFFRSWILYYVLLPPVGAVLATIVYLALRAGLFPSETSSSQPDPYGIAAIAGLVGLFSSQAAEMLESVFETIFKTAKKGTESVGDIPAPKITAFEPVQGPVGTVVVISVSNLTSVTGVAFGGVDATTFVQSKDQVTATVPAGAQTGVITLHTGAQDVTSDTEFTVTQ